MISTQAQSIDDNLSLSPDDEGDLRAQIVDMPDDVQDALDMLISYYDLQHTKPVIDVAGDPLEVTSSLVTQVKQSLPTELQSTGEIFLNYIVREIVAYCQQSRARYLTFKFAFERQNTAIEG